MAPCTYIPLYAADLDDLSLYLNELFDIDTLRTEDGIFIHSSAE